MLVIIAAPVNAVLNAVLLSRVRFVSVLEEVLGGEGGEAVEVGLVDAGEVGVVVVVVVVGVGEVPALGVHSFGKDGASTGVGLVLCSVLFLGCGFGGLGGSNRSG